MIERWLLCSESIIQSTNYTLTSSSSSQGEKMAELAHQTSSTDVYTTGTGTGAPGSSKNNTIWRGLLNWLSFFFQVFIQLLQGTPTFTNKFLSFRHRFLLSSSSSSSSSSSLESPSFSPLPVVDEVELSHLDSPSHLNTTNNNINNKDDEGGIERLTVVLDLDETLVSAYETSSLPASIINQAKEAGLMCFELECVSLEKDCDGNPKVNHVTVFERPNLKEFLKQISEFADLILFTAGLEGYARPLVDTIDKENLFKLRLYRPSTCSTEYREHVKDLSCLSKDLTRTVIVDNNPFSFLLQPLNGIPCVPFVAGQQPRDDQLLEVLLPLLKHLSLQKDVQHALYERFHMPEWFEKHGIPACNWTCNSVSQGS